MAGSKRRFGEVSKLPSGRYRARYVGPDGARHSAPFTFQTKGDADAWLSLRRAEVIQQEWEPPGSRRRTETLAVYADAWLATRPLKPRTKALYASLLRVHILPTLGDRALPSITPVMVRSWYAGLDPGHPTARAHAYQLLRTILATALDDGALAANPARIKGAGTTTRKREIKMLTVAELGRLVEAIPKRYEALVLLGAWCAMKFGELAALRRSDLDLTAGLVHIRQAVTTTKGQTHVGEPKSAAGRRSVSIPPHLLPLLREHVKEHAAFGRDGLVFPPASGDGYLALSTLHRVFDRAKVTAGRPDLTVHQLRHFGAIMAARSGATLGELQQRLGHSTAQAAMIYQSAVSERPAEIAAALSRLAEGG
jgi:integrase